MAWSRALGTFFKSKQTNSNCKRIKPVVEKRLYCQAVKRYFLRQRSRKKKILLTV